jgi:RimJ/RimL family protein N-acetyltransferase
MPSEAPAIAFRPVETADLDLLGRWMESPHWREWWGEPETELGYIRDMIEGRDTTRPFLFLVDGKPAGYIQYWFIGHHQNETWVKDNPWLLELPADAIGVDLSIGDVQNLSRGLGTAALKAFVAKLRAEGFRTIVIDPDPANARAVRAYEKAGFRPIPELERHAKDGVLLMRLADPEAASMGEGA